MSPNGELDKIDVKILQALQEDSTLTINDISERVSLSSNACWRRIKQMEEAGYILKRVALLDPVRLGVGVTVFVSIRTAEHSKTWFESFNAAVVDIPEVVEFYRLAGDVDYLLKLRVESISAYDHVYKRLVEKIRLTDVSAVFAMEEIKHTTSLPFPRGLAK